MTTTNKYLEQYDRMLRWYNRIKTTDRGRIHNLASENYQDELYAFFQICYHLKDWMKNDKTLSINKDKVEDFVNSSSPLRICGDICNGIKHLTITTSKIDPDTKIGKRDFRLALGGENAIISVKYSVECDKKIYDAFSLATECVEEWDRFIIDNINSNHRNGKIVYRTK